MFNLSIPKRRWVVESRPAMFPGDQWERSLGPFFRRKTAENRLGLMRIFVGPNIVALRVHDTRLQAGGTGGTT